MSVLAMGWRELFTSRKTKEIDAAMTAVRETTQEQAAATSRLENVIERVLDAKTGRRRNGNATGFQNVFR